VRFCSSSTSRFTSARICCATLLPSRIRAATVGLL
jgi:hypothetical protein